MPDPLFVLGLPEDADDAQVRAAYLAAVRRFPPERYPEQFQRITEAHDALRDEIARARSRVFGCLTNDTVEMPEGLVPSMPVPRKRIGIDRWLTAISRNCGNSQRKTR